MEDEYDDDDVYGGEIDFTDDDEDTMDFDEDSYYSEDIDNQHETRIEEYSAVEVHKPKTHILPTVK